MGENYKKNLKFAEAKRSGKMSPKNFVNLKFRKARKNLSNYFRSF